MYNSFVERAREKQSATLVATPKLSALVMALPSSSAASLLKRQATNARHQVFDYFVVGDCSFLVMEYIGGRHPCVADYATVVPKVARCL